MTTREIKTLIAAIDPAAKHYTSSKTGDAFTVWAEYRRIMPEGAEPVEYGWAFEVDRYVHESVEEDAIVDAIEEAFARSDRIHFTHEVEYDREGGYVRHIFDCEGI